MKIVLNSIAIFTQVCAVQCAVQFICLFGLQSVLVLVGLRFDFGSKGKTQRVNVIKKRNV